MGNKDFVSRTFRFLTCTSRFVSSLIGMETFHTSRLLEVMWSNAGFISSLIAFLSAPTFSSQSILTGNMQVESSPRTQQFSRSRDDA